LRKRKKKKAEIEGQKNRLIKEIRKVPRIFLNLDLNLNLTIVNLSLNLNLAILKMRIAEILQKKLKNTYFYI
jgi:hypothetical protein